MRLGIVRGKVVLNVAVPVLRGASLLLVEPVTAGNLAARNGVGGGRSLVVVDHLNAADGEMVGFVEGSEAGNAFHPQPAAIDAYCALIVRDYEFRPPEGHSGPSPEGSR